MSGTHASGILMNCIKLPYFYYYFTSSNYQSTKINIHLTYMQVSVDPSGCMDTTLRPSRFGHDEYTLISTLQHSSAFLHHCRRIASQMAPRKEKVEKVSGDAGASHQGTP